MTWDAILAILLNVAIPVTLAILGGALAIRSLKEAKSTERSIWLAIFIGLGVAAIVLAFAQQILITRKETQANLRARQTELRMSNDNKYMQGQLESIRQVLTAALASGQPGSKFTSDVLRAIAGVTQNTAQLSNQQLRRRVADVAERMRQFDRDREIGLSNLSQKHSMEASNVGTLSDNQKMQLFWRQSSERLQWDQRDEYNYRTTLLPEAVFLRALLLDRIPPEKIPEELRKNAPQLAITEGMMKLSRL